MSSNTPSNIIPASGRDDESAIDSSGIRERPASEKVSPSQRGSFLSALERKKDDDKKSLLKGKVEDSEEKTGEVDEGIFRLAALKKAKQQTSSGDDSSGEEGGESVYHS
jgi:hypothetical protein